MSGFALHKWFVELCSIISNAPRVVELAECKAAAKASSAKHEIAEDLDLYMSCV
jgi:hypothetical protein